MSAADDQARLLLARTTGRTIWGDTRIDRPERLRALTRVRATVGERRYRALRYSMDVADARQAICRIAARCRAVRKELDGFGA